MKGLILLFGALAGLVLMKKMAESAASLQHSQLAFETRYGREVALCEMLAPQRR